MSLRLRAFAALGLIVLFPVFVVAVVIALLIGAVWAGSKTSASIGSHIAILAIPVGVALVVAVRDIRRARARAEEVPGVELNREEHPTLWAELDDLAQAMQQPSPARVVVHPTVNAFVTEVTGRREMMIGYPLLAGLDQAQLRSVLAHEMGHLGDGHTKLGARAYRAGGLINRTVAAVDNRVARWLLVPYQHLYLLVAHSVMRDHERAADEWSARLAGGPEAAATFPPWRGSRAPGSC